MLTAGLTQPPISHFTCKARFADHPRFNKSMSLIMSKMTWPVCENDSRSNNQNLVYSNRKYLISVFKIFFWWDVSGACKSCFLTKRGVFFCLFFLVFLTRFILASPVCMYVSIYLRINGTFILLNSTNISLKI